MKTIFIVAAVLVAAAAGQSLDILNRYNSQQDRSLDFYNSPIYSRFYRRLLGHPLERSFIYGESLQVPAYLQDDIFDVNVLQFEDIIAHPLFRVYYGLPFFRQYWSYPMFQRYVCSQYFQRFWENREFQQYFINPVLFYKYIYPLVTLFQNGNTPYGYPYSTTTPTQYPGYPYSYPSQYPAYPYSYPSQYPGYPYHYPTIGQYQQHTPELELYYKNLLETMMTHLYPSKDAPSQLQEVVPDAQITPEGTVEEETVGKVVDPVTGNAQLTTSDAKHVDETIIPTETVSEETISTTSIPIDTILPKQETGRYNNRYNNPVIRTLHHRFH